MTVPVPVPKVPLSTPTSSAPLTAKQKLEMQMKAKMEGRPIPTFDDEDSEAAQSDPPKDHIGTLNNPKIILENQMKSKIEGRPIPQVNFEDEVFHGSVEEKGSFTIPVPVRGANIQSFSSISPLSSNGITHKASISSPKSTQIHFYEDPSQVPNASHFGLQRIPQSGAGDLEIHKTLSHTQSLGSISAVVAVNDENMDDVLRLGRGPPNVGSAAAIHALSVDQFHKPFQPPSNEEFLESLAIVLKKVSYPSDRLSRRIKIWYCSSGFALSTAQEVEQFVQELKLTGDTVLQQFADEKFDKINDWANLLEVLRKYEQKMLVDMPNRQPITESVFFEVELKLHDKSFLYKIDEEFNMENLIRMVQAILTSIDWNF